MSVNEKSKSLVAEKGTFDGVELSFCLPFNTYFEVLATGASVRKHRVTIWLLGSNSYTRFEQQEKGLFGRDVFLTVEEGNEGLPGFHVNVRVESMGNNPGEDWTASKVRSAPEEGSGENFMVLQSIDSEADSASWDDCSILFNITKKESVE